MLFLDRSCFLNKNKNHHLGYEKSGFSWLLMEIYDEPFLFQEQVGLKLLGRQVKNHRVAMFFSFPWAWPINQSQLVTYQQALGEPDERREAASGAVGEAGSDCESKLHLLKRPDVNQLTLLTSSTLLLRILVFMLQKIQAIFFLAAWNFWFSRLQTWEDLPCKFAAGHIFKIFFATSEGRRVLWAGNGQQQQHKL